MSKPNNQTPLQILFREKWPHTLHQQFIALGIEVQFVRHEQFRTRLAVHAERKVIRLDVFQVRSLVDKIRDETVHFTFMRTLFPARDGRAPRDENNFRFRRGLGGGDGGKKSRRASAHDDDALRVHVIFFDVGKSGMDGQNPRCGAETQDFATAICGLAEKF